MLKKEYVDIDSITITDQYVDMIDIEVNTPDHTYMLGNGIMTHNSVGMINQLTVDAKITDGRGSFLDRSAELDPKTSTLSVNSAMIPFVGSTDACRVMFSGSQGRQTIPVHGLEPPLVQTGYESMMTNSLSDTFIKKAKNNGIIKEVNDKYIVLKYNTGQIEKIDLHPKILRSGQGQDSLSRFNIKVKPGDKVKKNHIIAEGTYIHDGVISSGANLLCAIMTYEGYSFEDGYIISEHIANKTFKSTSYHEKEVLIEKDDIVKFVIAKGTDTKMGDALLIRSSSTIESMIDLDIDDVTEGKIIVKSPGGRVIDIEVYPNTSIKKHPMLKQAYQEFKADYLTTHDKFPTKFIGKLKNQDKTKFTGILVRFKIEKDEVCELGDKITNNFGGKGVLALIEKNEMMPVTPWGERVDVILNPIAIINRMNPSTLKEMYIGLIAKFVAKALVKYGEVKNKSAISLLTYLYTLLDGTSDKEYSRKVINHIGKMSNMKYKDMIINIRNNNYNFPIVIPNFKEPSLTNIKKTLDLVGAKAEYNLKLPKYGINTINKIAVGYIYYKKLEQQSGIKMSSRSTGLVNTTTGQPLAGKKVGGGQRIGEMDSWSIINHGAINVLKELYGPLSDDATTKNEIVAEIIQNGEASYREPKSTPTKDILDVYMKGLMLDAVIKN